ncbi:MAG: hypothetical protein AAFO07_04270 [Bacteroidota bacterium]
MSEVKLNEVVAKEYKLVDWVGGSKQHFGKFGIVDITTMTLLQARRLVQRKFPKLKQKEAPKAATVKKTK